MFWLPEHSCTPTYITSIQSNSWQLHVGIKFFAAILYKSRSCRELFHLESVFSCRSQRWDKNWCNVIMTMSLRMSMTRQWRQPWRVLTWTSVAKGILTDPPFGRVPHVTDRRVNRSERGTSAARLPALAKRRQCYIADSKIHRFHTELDRMS
jgi:hypothetical protein